MTGLSAPSTARLVLDGLPGAPGIGFGRLVRADPPPLEATERPPISRGEVAAEQARLRAALAEAAGQLTELAQQTAGDAGSEVGAIFEAQALFASDPALVEPALDLVASRLVPAEAAFAAIAGREADRLAAVDDEYFRERAADVRDVAHRVRQILSGRAGSPMRSAPSDQPSSAGALPLLMADDLDASFVAELRPQLVAGICLAAGAPTGHAAIVARALGVPLVLGVGPVLAELVPGTPAAIDGGRGRLIINPAADELTATPTERAPSVIPASRGGPGVLIEANVGSVREADEAAAVGVDGIGLVRTELLFLGRSAPPSLDEQRGVYRRILRALPDAPVTFRTFDIGGDKPAGFVPAASEANPALGIRGLRLALRHPWLLNTQLRALLEASAGRELHVMFPMVSTVDELIAGREALEEAARDAEASGAAVASRVAVGIMVEVPAAALLAEQFAPRVDFFSIGTNDLTQYTLAADRTNPVLAPAASPLQPAVLRLVAMAVKAAEAHRRPVAICGEAAANPLAVPLFVGLGVTALSVAVGQVGIVRGQVAAISSQACAEGAGEALGAESLDKVLEIAGRLQPA